MELHQTSNGHTTVRLINGGVLHSSAEAFFEGNSRDPNWNPSNIEVNLRADWTGAAEAYPEGPEDEMAAEELTRWGNYEPAVSSRAQSGSAPKASVKGKGKVKRVRRSK